MYRGSSPTVIYSREIGAKINRLENNNIGQWAVVQQGIHYVINDSELSIDLMLGQDKEMEIKLVLVCCYAMYLAQRTRSFNRYIISIMDRCTNMYSKL